MALKKTKYALFAGYQISALDFRKFVESLPDSHAEPTTSFTLVVGKYDTWRRHLPKRERRKVPLMMWRTSADEDSGPLELLITRLFFPLRLVPYPNGRPEQRYDLEPARGEELIGSETETDKAKLQNFLTLVDSIGAKLDIESVEFGRFVDLRSALEEF